MSKSWFPRVVAETMLESTKDGEISRAPDPVVMIDGDLTWANSSRDPQHITIQVTRAPRSIVSQSPGTVLIHDAWSYAVGESPSADYPSVIQDAFGGRAQIDRPEVEGKSLQYGRFFLDGDSSQAWVDIGTVTPGDAIHFRYVASVQTPGTWTTPTEFEPRWEASARWAKLVAFSLPVETS